MPCSSDRHDIKSIISEEILFYNEGNHYFLNISTAAII